MHSRSDHVSDNSPNPEPSSGKRTSNLMPLLGTLAILSVIAAYLYWPDPNAEPRIQRRDIQNQLPILMVHGYTGDARNFDTMRKNFRSAGWDRNLLFTIEFSDPDAGSRGSNIRNANQLREKVDTILQDTGHSRIHIIAHSMGVLSTMYYIRELGGIDQISHFVNLDAGVAPPGGLAARTVKDVQPDAPIMKLLNTPDLSPGGVLPDTEHPEDHVPGTIHYLAVAQTRAQVFDGEESVLFPDVSHVRFPQDRKVFLTILEFLTR